VLAWHVLFHLTHASGLFCFGCFWDSILHFCRDPVWTFPIYATHIAGMTGACHHIEVGTLSLSAWSCPQTRMLPVSTTWATKPSPFWSFWWTANVFCLYVNIKIKDLRILSHLLIQPFITMIGNCENIKTYETYISTDETEPGMFLLWILPEPKFAFLFTALQNKLY
jgi:hypothetical protein